LNLTLCWHLSQPATAPVVDETVREEYVDLERVRQFALRDCGKRTYPAARQRRSVHLNRRGGARNAGRKTGPEVDARRADGDGVAADRQHLVKHPHSSSSG